LVGQRRDYIQPAKRLEASRNFFDDDMKFCMKIL